MYFILCIETATERCSVAVMSSDRVLAVTENNEGNKHASHLTLLIEEALQQAGVSLQQLDAIGVSKGPGSYTGLRVGVSTAKGLCYALNKPLIGIPTLQSLAAVGQHQMTELLGTHISGNGILLPMLDARRMEVYCAGYDLAGNEVVATEAKIIDETAFANELHNGPVYFMGNGAAKCKAVISHPNAFFIDDVHCSALGMQAYVHKAFENRQFENVAYFEPYYLKDFVATTPKKRV
jgi:tRNA threonylcarbamoyladenosine biosynthesis protein TsaB